MEPLTTEFDPSKQLDPQFQVARVGTACLVVKDDRFLLGLRQGEFGKNTWGLPGGHLEFGESVTDCIVREVKEETNLDVDVVDLYNLSWNEKFLQNRHYITIFVVCKAKDPSKLVLMEPEKCGGWAWWTEEEMRGLPLFEPAGIMRAIQRYKASQ